MVMIDSTDMSTPVTRGELRAELAQFEIRLEQKLEQKLVHLATKVELEMWGGALLEAIKASEQRLLAELARHTRASYEATLSEISVIDDKYAGLPPRVSRLEKEVFDPGRR